MKLPRTGLLFLIGVTLTLLTLPQVTAQTHDFTITRLFLKGGPTRDTVGIHFQVQIDGPVSEDPEAPTVHHIPVRIEFNGLAVEENHDLIMTAFTDIDCPAGCPRQVCRRETWEYKNVPFEQVSYCTIDARGDCGCPPLGTPVPTHTKTVRKPPVSGSFKVILDPDNEIAETDETNNQLEVEFRRVPATTPVGLAIAVGLLLLVGGVAIRSQRRLRTNRAR